MSDSPRARPAFVAALAALAMIAFGSFGRAGSVVEGVASLPGWKHAGEIWLLTTKDGAHLPATAEAIDFPVLVRLDRSGFDFDTAKPDGSDLRVLGDDGSPLHYEIESWDPKGGSACVWVRVPRIAGDSRQRLVLHWGNPDAARESDPRAVFGEFNGYVSALHLGDPLADSVGKVDPRNENTRAVPGRIGLARRFDGDSGIFCGDDIATFPHGADASSTEAWFFAERVNSTVLAWGQEQRPGKVMLNLLSPPRAAIQCYFADVFGKSPLVLGGWNHVVHTYEKGDSRIYLNGELDGTATPILDIPKVVRFDIGGWHGHGFRGDVDEVRISRVARSPDWIHLEYENQKPTQTLVGSLVRGGSEFGVSTKSLRLDEGGIETVSAQAGGAQKVSWRIVRDGEESVVAVDAFEFTLRAPRVTHDETWTLRFVAVYPSETRTIDVPVTIRESIPEPAFTLAAPKTWDGRSTITIEPTITNATELEDHGVGDVNERWRLKGVAVSKAIEPGRLVLERALGSGTLTIECSIDNGGASSPKSIAIEVKEPDADAWVAQPLPEEEGPESGRFYARDDSGMGSLVCRGKLAEAADSVFVRVAVDGAPFDEKVATLGVDRRYSLVVELKPGLVHYSAVFGSVKDGRETVLKSVDDILCGDAFIVTGQSNALATDFPGDDPPYKNPWVRTFGSPSSDPSLARTHAWGTACCRDRKTSLFEIGYWALDLGRRLVESEQIPVCFVNGAVGGTRIDQHRRNASTPDDVNTIYGRLLWRVREAKLTHGIRAILWHQGESDQGADGPSGRYGFETYHDDFVELAAGWRRDYPNVQHWYAFQIWPKACAMGVDGSDNMLREVQRELPRSFSRFSMMSTLGITPAGGCHFPFEGWAEFARLIHPLVERDLYGKTPLASITPPDLLHAYRDSKDTKRIRLEFDQRLVWNEKSIGQFYLDGARAEVEAGRVDGNVLTLELREASSATTITYLDSAHWSQDALLRGENGIAALTFCKVPIEEAAQR